MFDAILLDLDDTLHPEADFVRSGHAAVARVAAERANATSSDVYRSIRYDYLKYGRVNLFDRLVQRFKLPAEQVAEFISVYRDHVPCLSLDPVVAGILEQMHRSARLVIVTDGQEDVQARKVAALGLGQLVDAVVYTWKIGAPKPSPAGYLAALKEWGIAPDAAVIVGDDPEHDVAAAVAAEISCVRVVAHRFAELPTRVQPGQYAEVRRFADVPQALSAFVKQKDVATRPGTNP